MVGSVLDKKRKVKLGLIAGIVALTICVVLCEILIGWIAPQRTMYPRRDFSAEYGFLNYRNTQTIHQVRGKWRFIYTTNEYRNRGEAIAISNEYWSPNIVVLGDSNSFGVGVNDGEEYSSVLAEKLQGKYGVTNLAVGGWGLTQHIRRFYEFGRLYNPELVILQFSENDLRDNLNNQVTIIRNGRFEFADSSSGLNWVKKYLSASIIQKSQIYNLVRDSVYTIFASRHIRAAEEGVDDQVASSSFTVSEQLYYDLLMLFVDDLTAKGISTFMISETPDRPEFLQIAIRELESKKSFRFIDVEVPLQHLDYYGSDEGHRWGKDAHTAIGEHIAEIWSDFRDSE